MNGVIVRLHLVTTTTTTTNNLKPQHAPTKYQRPGQAILKPIRPSTMKRSTQRESPTCLLSMAGLLVLQISSTVGFGPTSSKNHVVPTTLPWRTELKLSSSSNSDSYDWADLTNRLTGTTAASTPSSPVSTQPFTFHWPSLDVPNLNVFEKSLPTPSIGGETQQILSIDALTSTLKEVIEVPSLEPIAFLPIFVVTVLATLAFYTILAPSADDFRQGMEPYPRGNYDPVQAKAFYSRHPLLVIQRAAQVFRLSNGFLGGILWDKYILRDEERNRAQRAEELLTLVTNLGPTAIKIGQALSVRPDLIPEEYAKALSTLQDSVPPFDGAMAKTILRRELGQEKYSHLKDFPFMTKNSGPVASASIGQGTLYLSQVCSMYFYEY